ncbi:MAG TPA: RuBisCO large subunit C-terminal-like domain-containing protein [Gemmatimonadales bacterium]|nr:RuBisCO large subunit C-terminal-like domain-containing protein [Gemmatimonadales bacterium]
MSALERSGALRITYRVSAAPGEIESRAEALLLEQTVELPRSAIRDRGIAQHILGRVERIEPDGPGQFRVEIVQPLATTAHDPAQLLNVIFGNSSLQADVMLADVALPDEASTWLPGPRLGIAGLRRLADAASRPLVATALKPMGLDPRQLAGLCRTFARAGIDLVKDDHGLADHAFSPFEGRVEACLRAVEDTAAETGHRALYVPNLAGTPERVLRQLEFARAAGAPAVMISPMIVGLPLLHQLASAAEGLPILAHPALAGVLRVEEPVLFGKLFRWYGADAVIFPHAGGRFSYSRETCSRLAGALRAPSLLARPAFPMPAGGIRLEQVPELLTFYGRDCILLIGGSLYEAGDALFDRTKALVDEVARAASEGPAAA